MLSWETARQGQAWQVRLVINRRVAVDTGEAFWGMERQVGYVQKWYVQVRWVLLRRGPAGQARHGEMGRNGRGWSRVRSGKFSEEKIWIVSTRMFVRTA